MLEQFKDAFLRSERQMDNEHAVRRHILPFRYLTQDVQKRFSFLALTLLRKIFASYYRQFA
ncbi:MAG TPA: hypothetical protein VGC73_09385, partial [Pyrinomonadaceae bacterium]